MPRFYSHLPYYLVIFFFYWPLYELTSRTVANPDILKGLYVNNILVYSPLVTSVVSLFYSYRFKFSIMWLVGVGLLFCFTIFTFGEFILFYFLAYEIFAIIGMASGIGIKRILQKMKNKKLSQNP